jgi:vacuolar-type H+-ATPase subunit F/Vma7
VGHRDYRGDCVSGGHDFLAAVIIPFLIFMPSDLSNPTPPELPPASGNFACKGGMIFVMGTLLLLLPACSTIIAHEKEEAALREITEQLKSGMGLLAVCQQDLNALLPTIKGSLENPMRVPVPVDDARNQIAKVKDSYEQFRTAATTLIAKSNETFALLDQYPPQNLSEQADTKYWVTYSSAKVGMRKLGKTFSDTQVTYGSLEKSLTLLDKTLADLQANPGKWKRDSDGKIVFLDEELQTRVTSEIDQWRGAKKQSDALDYNNKINQPSSPTPSPSS